MMKLNISDDLYYDLRQLFEYLVFSDDLIVDNEVAEIFLRELEECE